MKPMLTANVTWMIGLAILPLPADGQPRAAASERTTTCELARRPERFSGRIVTVRGLVRLAFEDFHLSTGGCGGADVDGVWLEYGSGPARQPAAWCCGDMVPRDPLSVVENRDFRVFHRYLTARRRGGRCYDGQCYQYRVTATLTGRFDMAESQPCPGGNGSCCYAGFGHLGLSCYRLVITRVSDVSVERANSSDESRGAKPVERF